MVGRTITEIRWMTEEEMAAKGWERETPVIVFDDGTRLYAASNDEESGSGTLVGVDPRGRFFHLYEYMTEGEG